jgi:hypothetical protein
MTKRERNKVASYVLGRMSFSGSSAKERRNCRSKYGTPLFSLGMSYWKQAIDLIEDWCPTVTIHDRRRILKWIAGNPNHAY